MDNKSKVWLIVLAFLMIAALTMCVVFKLKLDDVSDKYEAVVAAAEATPSVTVVSTEAAVTPDATGTEEPTAEPVDATDEPVFSGYTLDEVEQMALDLEQARAHEIELEAEVASLQAEVDAYETDAEGDIDTDTRIEAMKAENEVLAAKVDVLSEDNAVLTSDLEYANAEKAALEKELESANAANETIAAELEAVNAENQQLSGELEAANAENQQLSSDLEAANARISELDAEISEFRKDDTAAAVVYVEDAVNVAADGVSAKYDYTCGAPEGSTAVCQLFMGDMELYTSPELKSGEKLVSFEIAEALAAGNHEGTLTVTTYRADGSVASRITLPVTIVVAE